MMASAKGGANIEAVQSIKNRFQLIALGAESVSLNKNEQGEMVEVFTMMQERGSIARAFMHGLLDLSTGFIWELIGTPIESSLDEKKYFSLKVTFNEDNQIKTIELVTEPTVEE